MPDATAYDLLWSLPNAKIAAEPHDRVSLYRVQRVKGNRIAIVMVPNLVGHHLVERRKDT